MRWALIVAACCLLVAPVATGATRSARIDPQDRVQIGVLIDRFVKDAVRREDLRAAWTLAGPDLRGGTTRQAWVRGTGVTVEEYPARGSDFRNAWTGRLLGPGHAELSVMLFPDAKHSRIPQTAMTVDVRKLAGRWVVNSFYPAATFGAGGVVGPADFGPQSAAGSIGIGPRTIRARWLAIVGAAVAAAIVLTPAAILVAVKRRDRRAQRAFAAVMRNE